MEGLGNTNQTYQEFKYELDSELQKVAEGFVRIGYLLKVARDTAVLQESGYKTVAEFAQSEYGLTKDVVSRYIAINDRYSEGGYSDRLQDQYRPYGVAKLAEMLTLSDAVIENLSPAMSKTEIIQIKKEIKQEEKISDLEVMIEGQTEQQQSIATNLGKVLHQYFFEQYKEYIQLQKTLSKLEKDPDEIVLDVLAPSGIATKMVRVQGLGKFMLSIKGADQPIELLNVRSNEKELCSWEECIHVLTDMCPAGNGKKHWEKLYDMPYPEEVAPVQPKKPEKKAEPPAAESKKQTETTLEELDPEESESNVISLQERRASEEPEPPVITGPEEDSEEKSEADSEPELQITPEEPEVAPVQPEKEPEHTEVIENPFKEYEEQAAAIMAMITEELHIGNYDKAYRRAIELEEVIKTMLEIKIDEDSQIAGQMDIGEYQR